MKESKRKKAKAMMVKLRQLDWLEVIRAGDQCMIAGENVLYPVDFSIGWTVDRAFEYYRQADATFIFYRQVDE